MTDRWSVYVLIAMGIVLAAGGLFALIVAYSVVARARRLLTEAQRALAAARTVRVDEGAYETWLAARTERGPDS